MIRNKMKEQLQLTVDNITSSKKSLEGIKDIKEIDKKTFYNEIKKNLLDLADLCIELQNEVDKEEYDCLYDYREAFWDMEDHLDMYWVNSKEDLVEQLEDISPYLARIKESITIGFL